MEWIPLQYQTSQRPVRPYCARLQLPGEGMRIVFGSLVAIRFLITRNIIRR